jgi:hypothetical protein
MRLRLRPFYPHQHPIIRASCTDIGSDHFTLLEMSSTQQMSSEHKIESSSQNSASSLDEPIQIDPKTLYLSYGRLIIFSSFITLRLYVETYI